MQPESDQTLKQAVEEIRAICKHHNIGAALSLVSPTHSEWAYIIPPWCRVQMFPTGEVRIRIKESEFSSRDAAYEAATLTAHYLLQLRDLGYKTYREMEMLAERLAKYLEIDHTPYGGEDMSTLRKSGH
jgi:hypothetical protein